MHSIWVYIYILHRRRKLSLVGGGGGAIGKSERLIIQY